MTLALRWPAMEIDMPTQQQDTISNPSEQAKVLAFKVGWPLPVFVQRNGLTLNESARQQWLALSRQASKDQLEAMQSGFKAGCKTTVRQAAVWSVKAKRWDLAMSARVVTPECDDPELIEAAFVKAQARQVKTLATMRQAAIDQGANISEE